MPTFPRGVPKKDRVLAPKEERLIIVNSETAAQPANPKFASKLPGDPWALRGIPAIGYGVSGCINGTNPEGVANRKD